MADAAGPTILCLSRSYLSRLLPAMEARHDGARYLHVVQNERERAYIEGIGGRVVMSIESVVRDALRDDRDRWEEPADFREVTGYPWSPIASDRYLPTFPPEMQGRIAGALYHGLARVFAEHRIDAFLSEPVALFVTHCAFYLSRKHGARRLMWGNAWFPDWFFFADGIHISRPVRSAPFPDGEREPLKASIESYFDGVVADRRGPAYHPSFFKGKLSPLAILRQRRGEQALIVQPGLMARAVQRARLARVQLARLGFPRFSDVLTAGAVDEHRMYLRALSTKPSCYDSVPTSHDPLRVVYPLQYEPEASLLYFAPDFRDQTVLVENALRALPHGATLWVKEHPNQFGALGAKPWQLLKRKYGALRFVHGRQSGRDLIRNSALVVSVSSSAGMDALAIGRQVLVVGEVYYRDWPGATAIRSYAELAEALNYPAYYRPVENRESLIDALVEQGTRCYPGDPQPRSDLFSPENLNRLVAAVAAECAAPVPTS
ncbi:Capsule polysaccharide biosynthesis protein [Tsuneonella dongtanensis]|uniref:Capsule polysaccharide biosynthesis protein n=2 Tax=Tsuneonella dongtanensis TaxID=692370 RepID=A0A1B2AA09_9SPHN|nr:Capsule polysaccharide biosynthesis protein [Tsuneonella dongtanensis]